MYYGSKWRTQAGFVFSGRGKIMVTRRHVYVRFQVLKYEETFSAFIRARGVGSFGAQCYTHSSQMHEAFLFPAMHEAFNAFCVAFKDALHHFIKCTTVSWCSCLISSRSSCRSHLQIKGACTSGNNLFIFINVIFIRLSICVHVYLSVCLHARTPVCLSVQTYCMFTLATSS